MLALPFVRESPAPAPVSLPFWPFRNVFYGWAVALAGACAAFSAAPMFGPVLAIFVKPISDELGWSRAAIGLGFTIGTFTGSSLSALVGHIMDRRGARPFMILGGIVVATCMVGIIFMQEEWHFWILLGLGRGAALAGLTFGSSVATANWFVRKRGRASSVSGMGMRLGQVVLPLLINLIVAMSSWRHAFGAMAAIVLAAIIPTSLYVRRRPEDMGLLPDGASSPGEVSPSPATAQTASEVPDKLEEHWSLREAMRTKALWLIVVVTGGTFFVNGGVNLHAIAYFQDQGLPAAQAVTITTIFASTTVGAAFLWGYLCDRIHVRYACMACSVCYLLAMFIIVPAETYPAAAAFGVMFGLASGGWTTVERLLAPNYFGRRSVGAIRGFVEMVSGFFSSTSAVVAGLVRDLTGSYVPVFLVYAGVATIVIVALLLAVPPRKKTAAVLEAAPA